MDSGGAGAAAAADDAALDFGDAMDSGGAVNSGGVVVEKRTFFSGDFDDGADANSPKNSCTSAKTPSFFNPSITDSLRFSGSAASYIILFKAARWRTFLTTSSFFSLDGRDLKMTSIFHPAVVRGNRTLSPRFVELRRRTSPIEGVFPLICYRMIPQAQILPKRNFQTTFRIFPTFAWSLWSHQLLSVHNISDLSGSNLLLRICLASSRHAEM